MMKKLLLKYYPGVRRLKLLHLAYNIANYKKLNSNKSLYKVAGIKKNITQHLAHKDFKGIGSKEIPWLDKPNAQSKLINSEHYCSFNKQAKEQINNWIKNGYAIFNSYLDESTIDSVNQEIETIIANQKISFEYSKQRLMNAYKYSNTIKNIANDESLTRFLRFLLGRDVLPFQTINFITGSETKAHADIIHMTTEPKGYLIGVWIALEDVMLEAGPLFYIPGSHKLPYVMSDQFETGNTWWKTGEQYYENYEACIEQQIKKKKLQKKPFLAKRGDLIIWHANLLHGGMPVIDEALTRKSLVIHYFAKDVICYHEITQRPAIIPSDFL